MLGKRFVRLRQAPPGGRLRGGKRTLSQASPPRRRGPPSVLRNLSSGPRLRGGEGYYPADSRPCRGSACRPRHPLALGPAGEMKTLTAVAAIGPQIQPAFAYRQHRIAGGGITHLACTNALPRAHRVRGAAWRPSRPGRSRSAHEDFRVSSGCRPRKRRAALPRPDCRDSRARSAGRARLCPPARSRTGW
jgi:hypothetical protein